MTDERQPKRSPGRPATYANPAERARAWRQRQKDLIAQAQQPAEPVIIEKVVEKIVVKQVEVPAEKSIPTRTNKRSHLEARKLFPALQNEFGTYGGEAKAKRLRVNAAKAASTAREILGMLQYKVDAPDEEKAFLQDVAHFFEAMNGLFQGAQGQAKRDKAKADAEFEARREARIAEAIRLTFGENSNLEQITRVATTLQGFASRESREAEARRRGVDRVFFFINREYEFKAALNSKDPKKIAREIAEVRLEAGERGRVWKDKEEICYSPGWQDYLDFVRTL